MPGSDDTRKCVSQSFVSFAVISRVDHYTPNYYGYGAQCHYIWKPLRFDSILPMQARSMFRMHNVFISHALGFAQASILVRMLLVPSQRCVRNGQLRFQKRFAWEKFRPTVSESHLVDLQLPLPTHAPKNAGPVGCDQMLLKGLIKDVKRMPWNILWDKPTPNMFSCFRTSSTFRILVYYEYPGRRYSLQSFPMFLNLGIIIVQSILPNKLIWKREERLKRFWATDQILHLILLFHTFFLFPSPSHNGNIQGVAKAGFQL